MGDAAGELHHLEPALDVAAAVGDHLAVLAREQMRQLVHPRLDQALELEQHPRAPLWVLRRPRRLRRQRRRHRLVDDRSIGRAGTRALDLAGVGIEDVAPDRRSSDQRPAVHQVSAFVHAWPSVRLRGVALPARRDQPSCEIATCQPQDCRQSIGDVRLGRSSGVHRRRPGRHGRRGCQAPELGRHHRRPPDCRPGVGAQGDVVHSRTLRNSSLPPAGPGCWRPPPLSRPP